MIDELVNDYCILADDGAVIFASYDHLLEFVEKIRADERKRKTLAELLSATPVDETAKGEHEQKTPLKVLNLTVFTENRLRNGRVYDVETLQTMTNRDILAIPDIGKKALAEVLEALAKLKEKNHG